MNAKLLSIIIPSYNMEKYLDKCIKSCQVDDEELWSQLDIIVVNDGSRDCTSEIAHSWAQKYPDIVCVIDKENGNYGSCINAALPKCRGTFVRVLDADDFQNKEVWRDFLLELSDLKEGSVDLVITRYCEVNEAGVARVEARELNLPIKEPFCLNEVPSSIDWIGLHMITYRLSRLQELEYRQTEGCSHTDIEWITAPWAAVRRVVYLPIIVTYYLLGREGQTMAPENFARNFNVIVKLVKGLITTYEKDKKICATSSIRGYRDQLLRAVLLVYQKLLLWGGGHHPGDLWRIG